MKYLRNSAKVAALPEPRSHAWTTFVRGEGRNFRRIRESVKKIGGGAGSRTRVRK
jgi:hypothetical protein